MSLSLEYGLDISQTVHKRPPQNTFSTEAVPSGISGHKAIQYDQPSREVILKEGKPVTIRRREAELDMINDTALANAAKGDYDAVRFIIRTIDPIIRKEVLNKMRNKQYGTCIVDDVIQEVEIAVAAALLNRKFLTNTEVIKYTQGIISYKTIDAYRTAKRTSTEPDDELKEKPGEPVPFDDGIVAKERRASLNYLMNQITERQRDILELRIVLGLSAEETARILRTTETAIRVSQHKALNTLRRFIRKFTDQGYTTLDELEEQIALLYNRSQQK